MMLPVESAEPGGSRNRGTPQAAAAAFLAAAFFATAASAGCGGNPLREPAALHAGAPGAALIEAQLPIVPPIFGSAAIVGMWNVTFTDSTGKLNDFGYQQWHSDGTEILNSGTHSPATENFCLGVWKETGRGHFLLNHYALSYEPDATTPSIKINIKEDVRVEPSGDVYKGAFTEDVFDAATGAQRAHITGDVTGQRIKLDSPAYTPTP